jgi:hypothetical protein
MTSRAKLLTQKQQLLGRLEENPGPNERAELERLLEKVDSALSSLELAPSDMAEDHDSRSSPRRQQDANNKTTSLAAARCTLRSGRR